VCSVFTREECGLLLFTFVCGTSNFGRFTNLAETETAARASGELTDRFSTSPACSRLLSTYTNFVVDSPLNNHHRTPGQSTSRVAHKTVVCCGGDQRTVFFPLQTALNYSAALEVGTSQSPPQLRVCFVPHEQRRSSASLLSAPGAIVELSVLRDSLGENVNSNNTERQRRGQPAHSTPTPLAHNDDDQQRTLSPQQQQVPR